MFTDSFSETLGSLLLPLWLLPSSNPSVDPAAAFDFGYKFILESYRRWGQGQHSPSFLRLHSSVTVAAPLRQLLVPFMYLANID